MSPKVWDNELVILADGQPAVTVRPIVDADTTKAIVRVTLVKLNKSKVRKIEIHFKGRMGKSSVSVEFPEASPSTHRRKIDYLARWVSKSMAVGLSWS